MTLKEKNMLAVVAGCIFYVLVWLTIRVVDQACGAITKVTTFDEVFFIVISIMVSLTFMAYNLDEEYRG